MNLEMFLSTFFVKALFRRYQSIEFREFFTRSVSLSQSHVHAITVRYIIVLNPLLLHLRFDVIQFMIHTFKDSTGILLRNFRRGYHFTLAPKYLLCNSL